MKNTSFVELLNKTNYDRRKHYLNQQASGFLKWVLYDDQFHFVDDSVQQVSVESELHDNYKNFPFKFWKISFHC